MTSTDLAHQIGQRVRNWRTSTPPPKTRPPREGAGLWSPCMTIQELAEAAGLMRSGLTEVELGKRVPTLPTLYAIAKVLGCDVSEFLPPSQATPKSEALAELVAAASQHSPTTLRRIARQVKAMRGDGEAVLG